jgi:poly [ADP-ribose] polymerase 6/8
VLGSSVEEDADITFDSSRATEVIVETYSAFMYSNPAQLTGSETISFSLPRDILPLALQAVYGFTNDPILVQIKFTLKDSDWAQKPKDIEIRNPSQGTNFPGKPLIDDVFRCFFTSHYQPRGTYRSERYVLTPSGNADKDKLANLVSAGYDRQRAENALILCRNNIKQALAFLRTGDIQEYQSQLVIGYKDCPLLFLALEIAECFLDLSDHCCICRKSLEPGLKVSACCEKLCQFQLSQMGLGQSVIHAIKQDPLVADLLVSIFSAAVDTPFLTPRPPKDFDPEEMIEIVSNLPSMTFIKDNFLCDPDLSAMIGPRAFLLLRWILLSNRTHLISLSPKFSFKRFSSARQFMSLLATPEAEREFRKLKDKYGSMYLFHGSNGSRWHSIVRNGLKNATGTPLEANGSALGAGIYFARRSGTSQTYAVSAVNQYTESLFGQSLVILALCEVAKVGSLIDHGWAHTLEDERACICRFLLVNGDFDVDVIKDQIQRAPKLSDLLDSHAEDPTDGRCSRESS